MNKISINELKKLITETDYSHLDRIDPTNYKSYTANVARNIRKDLKKHFPNIKFSVRSELITP